MSLVDWVACALALPVLLLGLRYAVGLSSLRGLRVRPQRSTLVPADAVPAQLRELLDADAAPLRALGFGEFEYRRMPTLLATRVPLFTWFATAVHADSGAWAAVMPSDQPEAGWLCDVAYTTYFEDGSSLVTTDGRACQLAPFRNALALTDHYTGSFTEAWATHQARCAGHPTARVITAISAIEAREVALMNHMFDDALARSRLQRDTVAGRYRLTWRGAFDFLGQLADGQRRRAAALARRRAASSVAPAATVSVQARAVADAQAMAPGLMAATDSGLTPMARLALPVLTAALTWATFAWTSDLAFAALLVATLALHEAGHYLAMRRFDYSNLRVFFVPFLGAAVSGHHAQARAWQRVVIYLAGPVPGLLLGVALLATVFNGTAGAMPALLPFALLLVVINYLNLLPLEPLDGGRIVSLLLFARHPRARALAFAAGLAGLFALALVTASPPLALFCGLLALGLPHLFRQGRLLHTLRARGVPADERAAIATLCEYLAADPAASTFPQRYATVKGLLPEMRLPLPTRRETVCGLAVYLVFLLAPVLLVVTLWGPSILGMVPGVTTISQAVERQRQDSRIEDAATPEARWQANFEAGRAQLYERGDRALAEHYLRAALALAAPFAPADERRIETVMALVDAVDDAQAVALLSDLLTTLTPADASLARARVLDSLARRAPQNAGQVARWLTEALALREAEVDADAAVTMDVRLRLVQALQATGDPATAEQQLRRGIDVAGAANGDALVEAPITELAWLLIDSGRPADALRELASWRHGRPGLPSHQREAFTLAEAWALFEDGQADMAIELLTAALPAVMALPDDPVQAFFAHADLALFCRKTAHEDCVTREILQLKALLEDERLGWLREAVSMHLDDHALAPLQRGRRRREAAFLATTDLHFLRVITR